MSYLVLKRKYLLKDGDCIYHICMNYMGDSVVCSRCSIGAGMVMTNLCFDEGEVVVKTADKIYGTGWEKLGAFIVEG